MKASTYRAIINNLVEGNFVQAKAVVDGVIESCSDRDRVWLNQIRRKLESRLSISEAGVSVREPRVERGTYFQDPVVLRMMSRIIEALQSGAGYPRSVLLYGPPGFGKTSMAEVISGETGIPLYIFDLPSILNSLLGESLKNLKKFLDAVESVEGVFLFDEVDSVMRTRAADDVGEIRRVLSYLFIRLDRLHLRRGLIIGTTNLVGDLDYGVFRRFDLKIKIDDSQTARKELVNHYMSVYSSKCPFLEDLYEQIMSLPNFHCIVRFFDMIDSLHPHIVGSRDDALEMMEFIKGGINETL